jgi:hypothetical protein
MYITVTSNTTTKGDMSNTFNAFFLHFLCVFDDWHDLAIFDCKVCHTHKFCNSPRNMPNIVHMQKLWPKRVDVSTKLFGDCIYIANSSPSVKIFTITFIYII